MSYWTSPMTKLEAVNVCLASISEGPVLTLDNAGVDAGIASNTVDEVTRSFCNKGWHWNRETWTLTPNGNGELLLPNNVSRVRAVVSREITDVVQRGLRLYDRVNNTYTFTKSLDVEIYTVLPFDDLPLAAKEYITAAAAMKFQQRVNGADTLDKDLKQIAADAWAEVLRAEIAVGKYNMLSDSWSTARVLDRSQFSRRAF